MLEKSHKKLNVLFLTSWYPKKENPTLGNFVQKHAEAANIYNNVVVLCLIASNELNQIEPVVKKTDQLTEVLVYYPKRSSKFKIFNFLNQIVHQKKAFNIGLNLVNEIFKKIDLVHLNVTYPAGYWAKHLKKKHNIPYVITEHSSGFHVGEKHAYPAVIIQFCKKILKNASYILPVSDDLKNHLKKLVPHQKFNVISNVVNEDVFQLHKKNKTLIKQLIHISNADEPYKNIRGIIHTIHKISTKREDFHLHIVSDGDIDYVKTLVNSLNCERFVTFYPTKTTQEIAEILQNSDALLMFSNHENFPCVIAEALMTGIPVISSNVNGIPEHINHKNGILVNPRKEDELENAIVSFLDENVVFNKDEIRAYAEKYFSYKAVGKSFDNIYRTVLNIPPC